ncbi:hypothetical protein OBBRIDRAFT_892155 [Obba rivulosa]|uniref:Uncharacterized protein n=1 Tax=Obba rivulosa TaxID=1052685 RepID=A0A8E2AKV3_9APHY|nr:hypothetical protein OBBRIDRAFT_892155 [Obba rivulosa]
MDVEERASKRSSTSSRKSRASLHLIPTPGVERALPPRYEPLVLRTWVVMSIAGFMIALAIAIEVARHISVTRNATPATPLGASRVVLEKCVRVLAWRRCLWGLISVV